MIYISTQTSIPTILITPVPWLLNLTPSPQGVHVQYLYYILVEVRQMPLFLPRKSRFYD